MALVAHLYLFLLATRRACILITLLAAGRRAALPWVRALSLGGAGRHAPLISFGHPAAVPPQRARRALWGAHCLTASPRARARRRRPPQLLERELAEQGYAGMEVRNAPMRTEIIIRATQPQDVLGEKGKKIRELTSLVQKRF